MVWMFQILKDLKDDSYSLCPLGDPRYQLVTAI